MKLSCGLTTAMETIFGWTIFGEARSEPESVGLAMVVSCMAVSNIDVSDLWSLEVIGITTQLRCNQGRKRKEFATSSFYKLLGGIQKGDTR